MAFFKAKKLQSVTNPSLSRLDDNEVQGGNCSKSETQFKGHLWVCGENSWDPVRKLDGDFSSPKPLEHPDEV